MWAIRSVWNAAVNVVADDEDSVPPVDAVAHESDVVAAAIPSTTLASEQLSGRSAAGTQPRADKLSPQRVDTVILSSSSAPPPPQPQTPLPPVQQITAASATELSSSALMQPSTTIASDPSHLSSPPPLPISMPVIVPSTVVHVDDAVQWQRQWEAQLGAAEQLIRQKDEQIEHLLNQSEQMAARLTETMNVLMSVECDFKAMRAEHAMCAQNAQLALAAERVEFQRLVVDNQRALSEQEAELTTRSETALAALRAELEALRAGNQRALSEQEAELTTRSETALAALRAELEALRAGNQRALSEQEAELTTRSETALAALRAELEALRAGNQRALSEQEAELTTRSETALAALRAELEALRVQNECTLMSIGEAHAHQLQAAAAEYEARVKLREHASKERDASIARLEAEHSQNFEAMQMAAAQSMQEQLERNLSQLRAEHVVDTEAQSAAHADALRVLHLQFDADKASWEAERCILRQEMDSRVQEANRRADAAEDLHAEFNEKACIAAANERALLEAQATLAAAHLSIVHLNAELAQLKDTHASQLQALEVQAREARDALRDELLALHNKELSERLNAAHAREHQAVATATHEIAQLKADFSRQLESLQSQSNDGSAALTQATAQHEYDMTQLRSMHAIQMQSLSAELQKTLAQARADLEQELQAQTQRALDELSADLRKRTQSDADAAAHQVATLMRTADEHAQRASELAHERDQLAKTLSETQARASAVGAELEAIRAQLDQQTSAVVQEQLRHESELSHLKAAHATALLAQESELLTKAHDEIKSLQSDLSAMRKQLEHATSENWEVGARVQELEQLEKDLRAQLETATTSDRMSKLRIEVLERDSSGHQVVVDQLRADIEDARAHAERARLQLLDAHRAELEQCHNNSRSQQARVDELLAGTVRLQSDLELQQHAARAIEAQFAPQIAALERALRSANEALTHATAVTAATSICNTATSASASSTAAATAATAATAGSEISDLRAILAQKDELLTANQALLLSLSKNEEQLQNELTQCQSKLNDHRAKMMQILKKYKSLEAGRLEAIELLQDGNTIKALTVLVAATDIAKTPIRADAAPSSASAPAAASIASAKTPVRGVTARGSDDPLLMLAVNSAPRAAAAAAPITSPSPRPTTSSSSARKSTTPVVKPVQLHTPHRVTSPPRRFPLSATLAAPTSTPSRVHDDDDYDHSRESSGDAHGRRGASGASGGGLFDAVISFLSEKVE